MSRLQIESAIETLLQSLQSNSLMDKTFFWNDLKVFCKEGFLVDLQTLSIVLVEKQAVFLIDWIACLDYQVAQQLDILVLS
ncbi:hypothetical protein QU577_18380 [Priestia megaterium]|uniref:hypothetical protein n=1 Tax=Priestia megaterium TaxID=1404 RepID=UPI0015F644F3|nr:hypothetical protein [Priestia megaterium]MDN3363736.1 hypothetical protein [Priestia megaterium]